MSKSLHIVGIGGAGMSGLARLAHESSWVVTGSDDHDSETVSELRALGILVSIGPSPDEWLTAEVVTSSPAVSREHPDIRRATVRGSFVARGQALELVSHPWHLVSVAGTHGKTTATSMAAFVARSDGRDASWLVGAPIPSLGANAHGGTSPLVMETDESFGTFTFLTPDDLILLNVDADHLDHYGSEAALHGAFADLVERTPGIVVVVQRDSTAGRLAAERRPVTTVGRDLEDYRISNEHFSGTTCAFHLSGPRGDVDLILKVPGRHNVDNAAAVAVWALESGYSPDHVAHGLASFRGAPRRFSQVATRGRTHLIDDYAHLPREVSATIAAARAGGFSRIGVIFQPHRVTRTRLLAPTFAGAFTGVERLIVTDVYRSGEPAEEGVDGRLILNAVQGDVPHVTYVPTLSAAKELAEKWFDDLDAIIVMGAGDVADIAAQWGHHED